MVVTTFKVVGMTCEHCVRAVTDELSKLHGVTNVEIELAPGLITLSSENALPPSVLAAAVEEAGYEVDA